MGRTWLVLLNSLIDYIITHDISLSLKPTKRRRERCGKRKRRATEPNQLKRRKRVTKDQVS